MMKSLAVFIASLLIACIMSGCAGYCEYSKDIGATACVEGEKPVAVFNATNMSYKLFGVFTIESGRMCTEGELPKDGSCGMAFFADHCTIDNNIKALKCALKDANTNRIMNLNVRESDNCMWSAGLVNCHIIKTTCIILAPKDDSTNGTGAMEAK